MNALKTLLVRRVFEDDDLSRVGAQDNVVAAAPGEPARSERPDHAEHFCRVHCLHFAIVIGTCELKDFAAADEDELLLLRR